MALLLPGGHPPLLTYFAAPVVLATVLATIPVSVVGLVASGNATLGKTGSPVLRWCLLTGNGAALACAVYALLYTLLT